ncbi:MAG: TIGR03560 family F420-dependent LLM class oxidoreductase [Anaerolineae bacterium]|nr:TIGR03560 family F420-dependent LLM class oxidoreductase [Anaerolineae bacterium]
MTQIGLMIEGQWGLTWERWDRLLQAAESLGYQCLFRSDHYTIGPPDEASLETWVSLTYAASHTRRIEFGPLVAPTTFRHPALTVRMAAAVDDLSGGRLVLGLGTGWHEREHKQFGIPFHDFPTRYAMLEEALEITTRLLRSESPVSTSGQHFPLDQAILLPRPKRPGGPPVLIGGNGLKKTLPLVARFADEWNAVYLTPQGVRERNTLLDDLLTKAGRQPSAVKRSLMTQMIFGTTDAEVRARLAQSPEPSDKLLEWNRVVGTPQQVVDQIGAYVEAGVQRFMFMWRDPTDLDGIEKLAQTVLPQFHQA